MPAFLFLLVKLNLAMGAGVVLVSLLRRPLRELFGAPIAYAIWFLVPIAGLACLLPPRAAAPVTVQVPVLSITSVINHIAPSALGVTEQTARQGAAVSSAMVAPVAAVHQWPDTTLLFFAAWALGALVMTLHLIRLQLRFSAAMRQGKAGPAVLGFLRPRIVTPDSFLDHFTRSEQAAILAHERIHLARQDARINALAALLRCLCWFNPLIHLGARWLRIDQELACDATAVSGAISRRDYAEALLKSQLVVTALPLGCNWPGSQHPLVERIALLKRKPPGIARRFAGVSLVLVAASVAGLGAWAAQPPVAAKPVAEPLPRMVLLAPSAASVAPDRAAKGIGSAEPAATANPIGSGHDSDASKTIRADRAVLPVPARVQAPSAGNIQAQMESALAPPPQLPPISVALNAPRTFTTPSETGTNEVVVANTPSGVGDPNAIVCRAPQRFAGSDRLGPQACGHNYEWWKLAINGKDLAADGKTLIDKPMVDNPTGEGDPDAVTCRTPKFIMLGPLVEVCRTNRFWAGINQNHLIVDARGAIQNPPPAFSYYGGIPYWPGDLVYDHGNNSWPGHDSGQAWQSSEPHPGGTLPGSAPVVSYPGYTP